MNKRTEQTRWTPKRLLSLLMALIMTLSLLPTAALAASDYVVSLVDPPYDTVIVGQESAGITAKLTSPDSTPKNVRLKVTVNQTSPTADPVACTIQYRDTSGAYVTTTNGYLDDGTVSISVSSTSPVLATFKLKFDNPGNYSYTVEAFEWDSTTKTATSLNATASTYIPVKDAIESVAVTPNNPEAGQQFTVTAVTNVAGNIDFSYGTQHGTVFASPRADGTYYANIQFTADNTVSGTDVISAILFDTTGTLGTKTATVNVGTPAANHTVVFRANGDNVYTLPAPQTVKHGEKAVTPVTPERKGYTFGGWYDSAGTKYDFATAVNDNLELYAKWTAKKITVNFENLSATEGVTILPDVTSTQFSVDSVAHFSVKVPDKYNTSDLLVWIGETLAAQTYLVPVERVEGTDHTTGKPFVTLYYQFPVTDDMADPTTVVIGPVTEKTFTVMMPVGHFDAEITSPTHPTTPPTGTISTAAADKKSASIVYGDSYTFTVVPHTGYDVEVYVNGAKQTATGNSYTVKNVTGPQSVVVVESAIPNYNVTFTVPLSGQTFTQSVARDNKANAPGVAPEREGYTFAGWYAKDEYNKDTGATPFNFDTPITKDTILFGKLTPKIYNIEYNLNGASGTAPIAQTKKHGQAVPLSTEVPTREGYTFLGWSENPNAAAPAYKSGEMYNVDTAENVTLYAVWQENVYNIVINAGEGYTVHTDSALMTVEHNGYFEFRVVTAAGYAKEAPSIWLNPNTANYTLVTDYTTSKDGGAGQHVYVYRVGPITADTSVNILAYQDPSYTVTYQYGYIKNGSWTDGSVYLQQTVGWNKTAQQPEVPSNPAYTDGYQFVGWYTTPNPTLSGEGAATAYDFSQPVTGDLTIYAVFSAVQPIITRTRAISGTGWDTNNWKWTKDTAVTTVIGTDTFPVDYGADVEFTLSIKEGYDASGVTVSVNNTLLLPNGDATHDANGTLNIPYKLTNVTKNTEIVVSGIVRKTVKVTYYANATDDVEHIPGQQILKYYLPNAADNGTLDKATPKRVGYDFKGWSTDPTDSPDAANLYQPGGAHNFVTDTNLYAIWKATSTTVTLEVSGLRKDSDDNEGQYEGKDITLTAEIEKTGLGTPGGSMRFYKKTIDGTTVLIETVPVTGEKVTLTTPVGEFFNKSNWSETYWVEYFPEEGKGFATSKSNEVAVRVWSAAISWSISGTKIASNGDVLKVYQNTKNNEANTPGDEIAGGTMIAGNVYWLEIPKVLALNGGNDPTIGHGYEILWQFMDDSGSWRDYTTTKDSNMVMIDADHSRYSFRANVVPTDPFTKAVDYKADGSLIDNQYNNAGLYTKQTKYVALQKTNTALEVTNAENELASVKINGATSFTKDHLAQFEGQAVTLTAKVTKDGGTGVETGKVEFYRLDGTEWKLIDTVNVETQGTNTGVASTTYTMGTYDSTSASASATTNKETFKAVYVANETYATSTTDGNAAVYIKSAKLMTPIIESELEGTNGAKATTYSEDLNGLLAGVQHTFKLRQDADQTAKDYSVVALDGRTVDATNYDIKWLKTTGSNEQEVDATGTNQIKVDENKVDDRYRVKLTGKGVFEGSEATSKDAVIGTKQNVTVTVKAIDAITKTPETDVYQLNEITLTATVAAANDKPTMQPTGTVTFYYKDGDNWVKLDSAMLAEDTNHSMTASITTNKLPVTDTTNTWRNVEITAVYEGNDTFNASGNYDATNSTVSAGTTANGVTDDTVTVYSSVVFNCEDENKKKVADGDKGIHISVFDGAFKANEKATLALSDIYTLDRELTDETLRNTIAKLDPDTDYTVRWQKLNGATAIGDAEGTDFANSKRWTDIGATGTTLVLGKVEQNTAYRAVITVNDQPITKGSFGKLDQGVIGTADANDGRQVYYSNVLMPTDTSMTVSVALNTSKIGAENTEGITEGETVTANVYLSGVVGAVPNANVTVMVTNDDAKGNGTAGEYKQILGNKNTVNGWNAFDWDTTGVAPGFYTLTVSATTNTGYAAKEITRSLIVRESSYTIVPENTTVTYNGRTQGLTVALNGFGFNGTGINEAANKSWTVKYYDKDNNLVEPTQAGKYTATITLPASAYWTEQSIETTFTIKQRSVSIADAIAQAKVYDGTTNVNIVEVILNDAETEQGTTGWLKSGENTGIINGDSIYTVATAAALEKANAGENKFTISAIDLRGDDAANYVWDNNEYTENIYVSRSQVYGVSSTDVTLKAGEKLPADAVYMIDQAGNKITSYDVLYYLHTDTEIKKVDNTNEKGLYTVIVRPKQDNYKSGVTLKVTVGDTTSYTPAVAPKPSTLITISNTAELYGAATGVTASTTNSTATTTIEYQSGSTGWTATAPTDAGRYLVKVTASTGDVAYGIYTITKAHPSIDFNTATDLTYNSKPQDGYSGTPTVPTSAESYFTYAGDVAIGYNTPADGNVDEQAPVDAGTYTVTLHVNETANYTAHEISKSFTIAKKALTIKADSWQTTQYDAFPDMTAGYTGLAAETGDTTPDTSLRDVQIAPEFLYNPTGGKSNYSNDSLDQVGGVAIQPIDALSKNYAITYENGQYTKQRTETNVDFAIHGLPQSSTGKNTVYYGDEIQLYPYGYYTTHANGSGIFNWSVSAGAPATIDADKGILKVTGVGEFIVTLTRGEGELQIKTEINVTALKKEVKVHVTDQDKVYSGSAQTYSGEVKAYDELYATVNAATTTPANNTRTDIGTQITTSRIATGSEKYQSLVYGGQFTINDKEASVAPGAQSTVYGTLEAFDATKCTVTGKAGSVDPVTGVNVASQTDAYNRLDVHDGYEILVAGTEDMNYNVKYTTDETAEDSAVTTYGGETFTSKTTKELNDATVYGETPNVLDWTLVNVIGTTRDSVDYADNLADFDLPDTFVWQDKDDCTGNKVTYKAANRTTEISGSTVEYNQVALTGPRTSTDTATDENYTLKFNTVENSGKALLANNYKLTNVKTGNSATTTNALTANSKGFIPAAGESNDVSGENFVEGSANIAQRPIKLEKAVTDAQLYWRLPQSQLYTALVNVLKAEENSVGRGLAKGHTIEDLDLSFTIGSTPVDKNNDQPMTGLTVGTQTVTVTVGDTNYKLEGGQYQFDIVLKNIQIEATYTTKTFTGFTVLIKVHNENGTITPLNDAKGLSYKIFKKTGNTIDKTTAYASGTLTYQNRTAYDDKGGLCGVFTATYPQLPLLNSGETYFIQMYEYGVELKTNS